MDEKCFFEIGEEFNSLNAREDNWIRDIRILLSQYKFPNSKKVLLKYCIVSVMIFFHQQINERFH